MNESDDGEIDDNFDTDWPDDCFDKNKTVTRDSEEQDDKLPENEFMALIIADEQLEADYELLYKMEQDNPEFFQPDFVGNVDANLDQYWPLMVMSHEAAVTLAERLEKVELSSISHEKIRCHFCWSDFERGRWLQRTFEDSVRTPLRTGMSC